MDKIIYKELSYEIVGILYEVYNELGYGYQEKFYQRAIAKHLYFKKIKYVEQAPYKVSIKNQVIGRYYLDFIVDNKIILEIKKGNHFSRHNMEQVKGYLKATELKLGILANFTSRGVKIFRILNPSNIQNQQNMNKQYL